jgi:hypothetical protein
MKLLLGVVIVLAVSVTVVGTTWLYTGSQALAQAASSADIPPKGALVLDDSNGAWFDRSLEVRGIQLVVAGAVGGQPAVPDIWAEKTAQMIKLLIDQTAPTADKAAQDRMIETLAGVPGTWHQGHQTGQRIGYGSGDGYKTNPLPDRGVRHYKGYQAWLDRTVHDDMVWYMNPDSLFKGDDDIVEIMEHLLHTLHLFGVRGAVEGSVEALTWDDESADFRTKELWLAMKEAIDNKIFSVLDYGDGNPEGHLAPVMMKEYMYLLNFSMWSFGKEFWDNGGSLAPEWSDKARTPNDVLKHNPLGHKLFLTYFDPVLTMPSVQTLRSMFKDNDGGKSGYIAD